MQAVTLDTHEIIKDLKLAGFNERQAEAQVHLAQVVYDSAIKHHKKDHVKQRSDNMTDLRKIEANLELKIEGVRTDLTLEIEKLRGETHKEIEKVRSDLLSTKSTLLYWMFGMHTAQLVFIFGFFGAALELF